PTHSIHPPSLHDALPILPGTMNTKYDEPFRVRFKDNGIKYTVAEFAADYEPVESTVGEAGEMPDEVPDAYDVLNLIDFDPDLWRDRKSTRLNSSHVKISY